MTAGFDRTVRIWDAETGSELALLTDYANVVRFSPEGGRIVTAGVDGAARVWKRRRPEWWWGVFWLWEFWLTAVFAGLFVWSVVRDRRALGKKEAA